MAHGFTIESDGRGGSCRAVCSCGWTSREFVSAGLAGAAWDVHHEQGHLERRSVPTRRRMPRTGSDGRRAYDGGI